MSGRRDERQEAPHGAIERELGLAPAFDEERIASTWERIARSQMRGRRAWSAGIGFAVAAAIAAVVIVLVIRGGSTPPGPLSSRDGAVAVAAGAEITARSVVELDDGSRVELDAATRLQVIANDGRTFATFLDRGSARFDIVPRGPRRWTIETPLATVEVLGTAFRVTPTPDRLVVEVERGVVIVRGDHVPGRLVRLTAGQRVEVTAEHEASAAAPPGAPPAGGVTGSGAPRAPDPAAAGLAPDEAQTSPLTGGGAGADALRPPGSGGGPASSASTDATGTGAASGGGGSGTPGRPSGSGAEPAGASASSDAAGRLSGSGAGPAGASASSDAAGRPSGSGAGPAGASASSDAAGRLSGSGAGPAGASASSDAAGSGAPAGTAALVAGAKQLTMKEALAEADRLRSAGQAADAADVLEEALRRQPEDLAAGLAAFTLGRISADVLGEHARAAAAFARVIELDSPASLVEDAYVRRFEALLRGGRRTAAAAALDAYERAYPDARRLAGLRARLERE